MDFIISLAHFCETHGPTSILSTQLVLSSCATCHPCDTPPSECPGRSWGSYERVPSLSSPFESPPTSPKSVTSPHNPYFPSFSSTGGSFQRRFSNTSGSTESDSESCENCSYVVPKHVADKLPDRSPGSPTKDGRRNGSPLLRTSRTILAQGSAPANYSYGNGNHDDSPDSSDAEHSKASTSVSPSPPTLHISGPTSPVSIQPGMHTHTLYYITTKEPQSANEFSLLRRSCIRTLSCEMLPRGSSSGPLMFGDPHAGYTVAYVFRLPDPRARGAHRNYALLALGPKHSWRVSMAYVKITEVFESIANQIIKMADRVLERQSSLSSTLHSRPGSSATTTGFPTTTAAPGTPPLSTSASSSQSMPPTSLAQSGAGAGVAPSPHKKTDALASSPLTRPIAPVSSFLSAKRVDPDGYPRVSRDVMRAKSLAEIVGREDFFVQLHAEFCCLLTNLATDNWRQ